MHTAPDGKNRPLRAAASGLQRGGLSGRGLKAGLAAGRIRGAGLFGQRRGGEKKRAPQARVR